MKAAKSVGTSLAAPSRRSAIQSRHLARPSTTSSRNLHAFQQAAVSSFLHQRLFGQKAGRHRTLRALPVMTTPLNLFSAGFTNLAECTASRFANLLIALPPPLVRSCPPHAWRGTECVRPVMVNTKRNAMNE